MKTFEELKAAFTQSCSSTIEKRRVKEQAIGRLCYLAEEDLSTLELTTLKRALGMNDIRWQAYKDKCMEGSSPGELA